MQHSHIKPKDPAIATLLSFLWTGAGQVYADATNRGIVLIVVGGFLLLISLGSGIGFLVSIPVWIWGMLDANTQAKNYNHWLFSEYQKKASSESEHPQTREPEQNTAGMLSANPEYPGEKSGGMSGCLAASGITVVAFILIVVTLIFFAFFIIPLLMGLAM